MVLANLNHVRTSSMHVFKYAFISYGALVFIGEVAGFVAEKTAGQ
jgi:hypothetical protein